MYSSYVNQYFRFLALLKGSLRTIPKGQYHFLFVWIHYHLCLNLASLAFPGVNEKSTPCVETPVNSWWVEILGFEKKLELIAYNGLSYSS